MTSYAALMRGIGPGNPNMRNARLREVCEDLGLRHVRTVLSSGNIVFENDTVDRAGLEGLLESAWADRLGFRSTTILRTRDELAGLVASRPFGDLEHGRQTYLLVTFSRAGLTVDFEFPHEPEEGAAIIGAADRELFTVSDTTRARTPDVMNWLEKRFGTGITSRTWLTVTRILARMDN